MSRWTEIRELTRLRTVALLRQPEAVFWVFVFPMVLAAVLGFAFQSATPPPSVVALLEGPGEDALAEGLEGADSLEVRRLPDRDAAELALRRGDVDVLLLAGEPPTLRLDPVRSGTELARFRVLAALEGSDPDAVAVDEVQERGSRYIDFLFPGLLGMNLMGTGLWSIGFAVAELRQRKVLKRLLVTPMRRSSFLVSFLISRLVFLALELVALTSFAVWVLGVPLRAGALQLGLVSLLGAVAFAGLGLLAASRVRTIEGVSGMLNFVMMPMWLGSGVFFSYERFPDVVEPFLRLLPLTALNDALRATMLEGTGPGAFLPELWILLAWLVVPFAIALRVFRWE